ncbi:MAG: helix-turn-helix domain-containing protein [Nitrospirae bacterium]|nr:helix-turn-helix domain-containing protein [Nitrospirota bacterium]
MGYATYYEDVFSIEEVSEILRVSKKYIMKLIKEGKFGAIRVGNEYRVPKSVIDSFFCQAITKPSATEEYAFGIWSHRRFPKDSFEIIDKIRAKSDKKSMSVITSEAEKDIG